jgi:ketosteroid isomerase-like protein
MGVKPLSAGELRDVEAIRKLRALYSHYLDGHDIDALAALFTEDAVCEFSGGVGYNDWVGRAAIAEGYRGAALMKAGPFAYLHAATNAWIEVDGETATGRWFLVCLVVGPEVSQPVAVTGVYDETYRKVDGEWFIARTRIDHAWRRPAA